MKPWSNLRGREVTVLASGIRYRGTVVEMGEESLLLRSATGFREIPWERVTRIEEVAEPSGPAGGHPATRERS